MTTTAQETHEFVRGDSGLPAVCHHVVLNGGEGGRFAGYCSQPKDAAIHRASTPAEQHCGHCDGLLVWGFDSYVHADPNTECLAFGGRQLQPAGDTQPTLAEPEPPTCSHGTEAGEFCEGCWRDSVEKGDDEPHRWEIEPHPDQDYDTLVTDSDEEARQHIAEIAESYLWDTNAPGQKRTMTVRMNDVPTTDKPWTPAGETASIDAKITWIECPHCHAQASWWAEGRVCRNIDCEPAASSTEATEGETLARCAICGGERVRIRGRFPREPKREVCPTCLAERIDEIKGLVAMNCGAASHE